MARTSSRPAQRAIARDWKTAEKVLGLGAAPKPAPPGKLACSASVSNSHPADYTTVNVYVRTAARAAVTTVAHCKPTSHKKSGTANSPGKATIAYDISGATRGYRVVVSVTVAQSSKTANCSTSFTPPDLAGWPAGRRNTGRGTLVAADKRAPGSVKLRTGGDSPRPGRRR